MSQFHTPEVIILGLIEGLTEFIPVSSTGHLILAGHILGLKGETAHSFEIFIQLGAILAVALLYWKRFWGLFNFSKSRQQNSFKGWSGILKLCVASFPVCMLGLLSGKYVKELLFTPFSVACALIIGGLAMWLVEKKRRADGVTELEEITYLQCLGVGLCQCFSLWPGISRSASTIIGGMLVGLRRELAVEFSFLLAVPVMTLATLYDFSKNLHALNTSDLYMFFLGFVVAFFSAILAVKFFIRLLARFNLVPFAVYRICLGVLVFMVLV